MLGRQGIGCQEGVGLIEVLASLLVLSVGIMGVVALQSRTLQFNQGAFYESRASILAADIADRIRANPEEALRYRIGFGDASPNYSSCVGTAASCSSTQLADYDLAIWREDVAATLPEGDGQIETVNGAGGRSIFIITVQYSDSRIESATSSGLANTPPPKQFVFRTSI